MPENIRVKVYPMQNQPFIKISKKPFTGLIFLFLLIASLVFAVFAKDWRLPLFGLLLSVIFLVSAAIYRKITEKAPKG